MFKDRIKDRIKGRVRVKVRVKVRQFGKDWVCIRIFVRYVMKNELLLVMLWVVYHWRESIKVIFIKITILIFINILNSIIIKITIVIFIVYII